MTAGRRTGELLITRELLGNMISHCLSALPNEACGILAGEEDTAVRMYPVTNADPSPVSFLMEPGEQFRAMKEMRQEGKRMVAIFHSHPSSPPYPSSKDVGLVSYPDVAYVIIGLAVPDRPEIRAYEIGDGRVEEISLKVS